MKHYYLLILLFVFQTAFGAVQGGDLQIKGSLKVGRALAPAASALADLESTTKGLLVPRMSTAQRTAISSPATGLIVYDTDLGFFYQYSGGDWHSWVTADGTQALTNKTVDGDLNTVQDLALTTIKTDVSNADKIFTFNGSGVPTASSTIAGATQISGQVPIANGGTGQSTVTNAINALLPDQTGQTGEVLTTDGTNISWETGGGGGSATFTKWLTNPSGNQNNADWNLYQDSSAVVVDGTGGTTTGLTFDRTAIAGEFYDGTGGFKFDKDAANRQGGGVGTDFVLETGFASKSQKITLTMPYKVSANYVVGDLIAYVYDKDGATVQLCNNDNDGEFLKATDWVIFQCEFYTTAGNDDYRLIFHIAGTNASAWTFYHKIIGFTDASPTPTATVIGSTVYTMTVGATTTAPTKGTTTVDKATWSRVNSMMSLTYNYRQTAAGSAGSGTYLFPIPSGYTIDTTNMVVGNINATVVGHGTLYTGSITYDVNVIVWSSTQLALMLSGAVTENSLVTSANGGFGNTTVYISYTTDPIPLTGISGNVISSTEASYKTLIVEAMSTAGQSLSSGSTAIVVFGTEIKDNFNTYNSTTGVFTAPTNMRIKISAGAQLNLVSASTGEAAMYVYKNGSSFRTIYNDRIGTAGAKTLQGTTEFDVLRGDTVDIRAYQNNGGGRAFFTNSDSVWLTITAVNDLSTFGVYGQFEVKNAESNQITPTSSSGYHSMTGNFLTLPIGTWRIYGNILFSNSGSAAYTNILGTWASGPGADDGTPPTALTSASGLTILSTSNVFSQQIGAAGFVTRTHVPAPDLIIQINQPTTIYLVPFSAGTAANQRITAYLNAERLR